MINGDIVNDSIDVIIPARGHLPWIQLSLKSIASQRLQPNTIVVIDDGLEDEKSVENLGNHFFGARFRLLKNRGRGISAALNTGVQESTAHWIARMDTDDIAYPQRLEQQILFLRNSADDVLGCGTQVRFINARGFSLEESRLPSSWDEIIQKVFLTTCFVHSSLVLSRSALMTTPYRSTLDGAEDLDLILRLCEKGKIVNLNQVLLDYRMHLSQESFCKRAPQTAIQELAFRLAARRRKSKLDPLDSDPDIAERFIQWRLSTSGYIRCRTFLTALRYMKTYLSGGDLNGFTKSALVCLKSIPVSAATLRIAWRVSQRAGAALVDEITPFDTLNLN